MGVHCPVYAVKCVAQTGRVKSIIPIEIPAYIQAALISADDENNMS
jgi:hypothetical protein